MNYIVSAIGDWNRLEFEQRTPELNGIWHFVSTPEELNKKLLECVEPKYIFFPHWRWIVPEEILSKYECVCFHMTDVPYGRGGSPLQNLIVRGHKDTVLTALQMEKGLDSGPVYLKEPLSLDGSAESIYIRVGSSAWDMIEKIVLEQPNPRAQEGTPLNFKRRTPSQSRVPEGLSTEQVYDYIRMLDAPGYPHAFLETESYLFEFENAVLSDGQVSANIKIKIKEK